MDRISNMTQFVAVVDTGSFTNAAERIGVSRAAISKSVQQLEKHLGARLLQRTTRRTRLTETGKIYYERCKAILNDIAEAEAVATELTVEPRGKLTINAPTSFGVMHLGASVAAYCRKFPGVQVHISLTDRFVDVITEGVDVVIRIAELEDSRLIARKIAPCRRVLCASPAYLSASGTPAVARDLNLHQCLFYTNPPNANAWTLKGPNGSETIRVSGPLCADNGELLRIAAVGGLGIALLPTFIVGDDLASGRLVTVLDDYCPPEIEIHAVYPSRRYLSAKVRTFVDFLPQYFGKQPSWDNYPKTT